MLRNLVYTVVDSPLKEYLIAVAWWYDLGDLKFEGPSSSLNVDFFPSYLFLFFSFFLFRCLAVFENIGPGKKYTQL